MNELNAKLAFGARLLLVVALVPPADSKVGLTVAVGVPVMVGTGMLAACARLSNCVFNASPGNMAAVIVVVLYSATTLNLTVTVPERRLFAAGAMDRLWRRREYVISDGNFVRGHTSCGCQRI